MNNVFETFKPKDSLIAKYVDYYYLDIKPEKTITEFECFPHYNTTISLYKSHRYVKKGEVCFDDKINPLQIFTPVRADNLQVKQIGKVHRIVIVFKPLGVQQFFKNLDFTDFIMNYDFFNSKELSSLFECEDISAIGILLDEYLNNRFLAFTNTKLESSLLLILNSLGTYSVETIAKEVGVSRRHLNRLFTSYFGVSVNKFNKIVLFRNTLEKKLFKTPEQSLTELAYEFNYADQSHLTKVFRTLTLNSPKKFLKQGTHLGNEDTFWHLKK